MNKSHKLYIGLFLSLVISSCTLEQKVDPNRPDVGKFLSNATKVELNNLLYGTEAQMRQGYEVYITAMGSIGREIYLFDADPRNTEDLLGKAGRPLDNNTYYLTAPYNNFYRTVKNANLLLQALDASSALTEAEKNGYRGFAKTAKAHQLLLALNMLHNNGVRIDVANPDALGAFESRSNALSKIRTLLDEAETHLNAAGSSFAFNLSAGYANFNTPADYKKLNRALAARVAIYQERWGEVAGLLGASFYENNGDMSKGAKFVYSTSAGDILNPLFYGEATDNIYAHPNFIKDAQAGDLRLNKLTPKNRVQDNLSATHIQNIYKTPLDPVPFIRNEELHLIDAEAKIQTNSFDAAVSVLNVVRRKAGLGDYTGGKDKESLLNELLTQRRYSLWLEGHRMVDLRRYDRLKAPFVPIDRTGDLIHQQFPKPLNE